MAAEHRYLRLWQNEDAAESTDTLRARAEAIWGAEGRSGLSAALNFLLSERSIQRQGNDWRLTSAGVRRLSDVPVLTPKAVEPGNNTQAAGRATPAPSNAAALSASENARPFDPDSGASKVTVVTRSIPAAEGPAATIRDSECADLRRLIGYYTDCVRYDERPSVVLYGDGYNRSFIPLVMWEDWWAESVSKSVQITVPLQPAQSEFVRGVARADGGDIFLGYPLLVHPPKNRDETGVVVPIFCIPAAIEQKDMRLEVALDFDDGDVNGDWLQRQFRTAEERKAFLRAAGLVDPEADTAEEAPADFLRIPSAAGAVSAYCGTALADKELKPNRTRPMSDFRNVARGIYNSAILFMGRRLVYNAGLVKELRRIRASAGDEDLKKTALWHIFGNGQLGKEAAAVASDGAECSAQEPIPFLPFNFEQEEAVRKSLVTDLAVVTGPPGTGKSQVAANLLANSAVAGRSAVFASRNHKALDAVVPRVNEILPGQTVLYRTRNPDTGETFTWKDAIDRILSQPPEIDAANDYALAERGMAELLHQRRVMLDAAEAWTVLERELGQAQSIWDESTSGMQAHIMSFVRDGKMLPPENGLLRTNKMLAAFPSSEGAGWLVRVRRWWWRVIRARSLNACLRSVAPAAEKAGLPLPSFTFDVKSVQILNESVGTLLHYLKLHALNENIKNLQEKIKSLKPLSETCCQVEDIHHRARELAPNLLQLALRKRFGRLLPEERRRMLQMRNSQALVQKGGTGEGMRIRWQRFFEDQFDTLIKCFPLWAIPSLSARHGLPLAPAIVDTVVLDEASQCDIASAIPLLYRAKHAVVIGDPNQLRPVHNMRGARNEHLMRKHGVLVPNLAHCDFLQSSLYDVAAAAPAAGDPILLRDHFRCHPQIAEYCNQLVYDGRLRVLTDTTRLRVPRGRKPGILWTEVKGTAESGGFRGAVCRQEIEAVGRELKRLLADEAFEGTVGVVTPFREQAKRLNDWAYTNLTAEALRRAEFVAATADGFQGDQRDVILCSPVYQPGLPQGAEWYVTSHETRNLWNVAISRAQALLHILGNRQMLLGSDVPHLLRLASPPALPDAEPGKPVFESVWERRLYDACVAAGLCPITQYPLAGCRLDLAFPGARLDVEVDGERYHRDAGGRRKAEDLWRDLAIRAAGWTPMRFWVYELRDDMAGCVQRIKAHMDGYSADI